MFEVCPEADGCAGCVVREGGGDEDGVAALSWVMRVWAWGVSVVGKAALGACADRQAVDTNPRIAGASQAHWAQLFIPDIQPIARPSSRFRRAESTVIFPYRHHKQPSLFKTQNSHNPTPTAVAASAAKSER